MTNKEKLAYFAGIVDVTENIANIERVNAIKNKELNLYRQGVLN